MTSTTEVRLVTKTEVITPQRALALLSTNIRNRRPSPTLVRRYAKDMQERNWHFNGESIKLSNNGQLLDGQHRLLACVEANTKFKTLITSGVPKTNFATIDTGKQRTPADVLGIIGEEQGILLARALRFYRILGQPNPMAKMSPFTNQMAVDMCRKHKGIRDSIEFVYPLNPRKMLSKGMLAALHYKIKHESKDNYCKEEIDQFITAFCSGTRLREGAPLYQLRERLLDSTTYANKHIRPILKAAFFLKAWRLHCRSERVDVFTFKYGKVKRGREAWPVLP